MANQRIAYGLCKKYGIKLKEGATPADAWKALKEAGHGDEVEKETSGGEYDEGKIFDNEHTSKNVEASNPKKLSEKMNVEGENEDSYDSVYDEYNLDKDEIDVDNEEEYERNKKQFKDFIVKHENYKSMVSAIKTQQGLMNKLNKQGFLNSADNKKWYDTTKKIADLTHKIEKDYEDKIGMNSFMSASAIAEYELMKGK